MANISSKISSIEPDDESAARAIMPETSKPAKGDKPKYDPAQQDQPDYLSTPLAAQPDMAGAEMPSPGWINITIILGIAAWLVCVGVIAFAVFRPSAGAAAFTAIQWASLAVFALAPILIMLILRYVLKQLSGLSQHASHLSATAQNLLTPDETAVSRTAIMARNIKSEVDQLNRHIDKAISRTATLQETLETQVKSIDRTAYLAENKTELIARQLSEEREALTAIASTYDDRMTALSANLDTHSANLAQSTQEAEQRINEARVSVEGAAEKINSASEIVRENTVQAANKLDANQTEIARLGDELKTRAAELDSVYSKHAEDLATLVSDLRYEQENMALSLEAGLQKMRDMSMTAQVSVQHLTDASTSGRQTVEALADAARLTDTAVKQRFADMEEMVRFSNARAESISEKAARRVQDSLAQTRKEISRIEYDMVALQDRLKYSDTGDAPSGGQSDTPVTPIAPTAKKKPKRRGILGLRPILDNTDSAEALSVVEPPAPQPVPPAPEVPAAPEPTPSAPETPAAKTVTPEPPAAEDTPAPAPKRRLSGLRPAPDASEEFSIPAMDNESDDLVIPDEDIRAAVTEQTDAPALILEIPKEDDIFAPDPDEDITSFDPDFRRPGAPDRPKAKPEKSKSWWKNLFGGGDDTSAIDQLTQPSSAPAIKDVTPQDAPAELSDADIVSKLSGMGLSPAAIVDDGCIIEAVNTRISKGPLGMSDVITHRLEDPVRHLYDAVSEDPALKADIITFARRFHHSLETIETDREAIRGRFESDAGRAFLLCDAALNR